MTEWNENTVAVLPAGSVEYSLKDAVVEIDDLIAALENAKHEGATHVVQASGNYRGASWASIKTAYGWVDDEEF